MQNWNWELLATAIGIVATILGGVWLILGKIFGLGRYSQRVDELDKRTCNAACDVHDRDIYGMRDDVKAIRDDMASIKSLLALHDKELDSVRNDVTAMKGDLTKVTSLLAIKYKNAAPLFALKNSPRRLNDFGLRVLDDANGMDFLQANKDFFFAQIDACFPKTAYDVENAAHTVCLTSTDNEVFNGLKNFVYNSPSYDIKDDEGKDKKYDLSLPDLCFVLSIPLRDMYLTAHPEIVSE